MDNFGEDFDLKTGIYSCLNKYMTIVSTRGQGHSLTFDLGLSHSMKILYFPSKAAGLFVTKFFVEPTWAEGTKICSTVQITLNQHDHHAHIQ